ncbi:MAG: MFS transporter [Thaumarchaeota archaeon]|nr:MFS transporter [Nitrososphaerota archaeon]
MTDSSATAAPRISEKDSTGKVVTTVPEQKKKISWFYASLPFNVALGPLSTYIQLSLLQSYGQNLGTVYIGLILTIFSGVTIPVSMIWGFATDKFHKRKPIIVLSFLLTAVDLFALTFTQSALGIGLLYALFALFSSASATPFNLLIMETQPKQSWSSAFAKFSMIGTIGNVIGLVLSGIWVSVLPLEYLVVPLSLLSLISAMLAVWLIDEPSFMFEREMIALQKQSLAQRLLAFPLIFLKIPNVSDFRRIFRGLRNELTSQVPILYLSIVAFNIAGGIFNTSLTSSMSVNGLSQSEIFGVYFTALLLQVFAFRYAAPYIAKRTLVKTAVAGLVLRSVCYALMGVSFYLISGIWFLVPSIIFYPLAAGIAYAIYYTSSSTMVFNSLGSKGQGSSLGVYSALVGVALMIGSFISGFTSVYLGYYVTFLLAAFFLVIAAALTSKLARFEPQRTKSSNAAGLT